MHIRLYVSENKDDIQLRLKYVYIVRTKITGSYLITDIMLNLLQPISTLHCRKLSSVPFISYGPPYESASYYSQKFMKRF